MKIAFIGLGNMGAPMATNLAKAGFEVVGHSFDALPTEGVSLVETAAEAVAGADVIYTMLPDAAAVLSVFETVLPSLKAGALFIDSSTIEVDVAQSVAARAAKEGMNFLDAPVSGGIAAAEAGTLTLMVGGTSAAFETAGPVLNVVGARVIHCGESGAGQATKICNNMLLGITMAGTCEMIALADRLGLDRQKLFDVVSTASGSCWSVNTYSPMPGIGPRTPADNDYAPGFSAALMLKDLRLSQAAAQLVSVQTPMGARAEQIYAKFAETEGEGAMDFSALLLRYSRDADS
ncbi:MAG: 3-hydroxyisobutyrate dehydrogenase [Pseudomonadota bacterium]